MQIFSDAPSENMGMAGAGVQQPGAWREKPQPDPLARKWAQRIVDAQRHWDKFHRRMRASRELVAGFDLTADPRSADFCRHRANLIHGTITALLPQVYARNPEIGVTPNYNGEQLKLFCSTLERVVNTMLERADLKRSAKAAVRSALVCGFGAVKVTYQRDLYTDPYITQRVEDTQDNIAGIERHLAQDEHDPARAGDEARKAALSQMLQGAMQGGEVSASQGLCIDRVLSDNLLIDPSVVDFHDYPHADWMAQVIPMKRGRAEALYRVSLDGASTWRGAATVADAGSGSRRDGSLMGAPEGGDDDRLIAVVEIWDRASQRVYTLALGCQFWLRPPYSPPRVGQRWYPFFLLPYQLVDGQFCGPSVVDLTQKLQQEHNGARDAYNKHRDLCKPGWIASIDTPHKSISRWQDSEIGEITLVDTEGRPLSQVIAPRQHPPIDPAVYDTSAVRYDWELVTGVQDSQRGSVVQAKTATEASIMQQGLSARVSEFRDQVEDWLREIASYTAQILLQEMTPAQVQRIMGPHKVVQEMVGGIPVAVQQPVWDWPQLLREDIFDMVNLQIRAGSTGSPDKLQEQHLWAQVLPMVQSMVQQILQLQATGMDALPFVNLLRETVRRFDERLDVEQFLPSTPQPAPLPPTAPAGGGEGSMAQAAPVF